MFYSYWLSAILVTTVYTDLEAYAGVWARASIDRESGLSVSVSTSVCMCVSASVNSASV